MKDGPAGAAPRREQSGDVRLDAGVVALTPVRVIDCFLEIDEDEGRQKMKLTPPRTVLGVCISSTRRPPAFSGT
jgi:hypothetical protein